MKKSITFLFAGIVAMSAVAENYTVSVGTNSVAVVPDFRVDDGTVWSNNLVVAQGDYVVNTNSPASVYFALTAATSTAMPTSTASGVATIGGVKWLRVNTQYRGGRRDNAIIFADSSATVYYTSDGSDATTEGSILDALRPARAFPGEQREINAIVSSGTATIAVEIKR